VWGVGSNRDHSALRPPNWPSVAAPANYDDGEFGGIMIGRGSRSTRRKPAPPPLCPPQIPHEYTRVWTRAAAVWRQRITTWAMERPLRDRPKSFVSFCTYRFYVHNLLQRYNSLTSLSWYILLRVTSIHLQRLCEFDRRHLWSSGLSFWLQIHSSRVRLPAIPDFLERGSLSLWVLRFPLPIFIPPISPQSPSPIIRGWYYRPVVAAVPKVPPH
jgi:hypothetical protein